MANAPKVMVSSTFYDLRQVRRDLAQFISDDLGFVALLSELPSFPIDPDTDTIENCRRRVATDADVLVLVVGGRYGSLDPRTGKSVTNLEYLAAREKRIPIYAFVDRRILEVLPVWRTSPTADYTPIVDSVRLFEFVGKLHDEDHVWVSPFDTAQEITDGLRIQFAHLFLEGLRLTKQLGEIAAPSLDGFGPITVRTALERPLGWEYLLFARGWLDEVERRAWRLRDYDAKLAIGVSEDVGAEDAANWLQTRLYELEVLMRAVHHVVNEAAPVAFGEPGQPGDSDHILWTCRKLGEILDVALDWTSRVRRARVREPFEEVAAELDIFSAEFIAEFRAAPRRITSDLERVMANHKAGDHEEVRMTIHLRVGNTARFEAALGRAREKWHNSEPSS